MYQEFFDGLNAHLEVEKRMERELDLQLSRRFNVLEFLHGDEHVPELGLSRVVAGLLHPNGRHGQGILFLRSMLEAAGVGDGDMDTMDLELATVSTEYWIPEGRLDILVHVPGAGNENPFCLAIENKPYADDGENQVLSYLNWLDGRYGVGFRLVYLSGNGAGPAGHSLPEGPANWPGRFRVMAYDTYLHDGNDPFGNFRTDCSLTEWVANCRQRCEAEKVRFFLADLESFCQRKFGGETMGNGEADAMREWLLGNPGNLDTARRVHRAWPEIRDRVCREFLSRLSAAVRENLADMPGHDGFGDIVVSCDYEHRTYKCRLWIYREGWPRQRHENALDVGGRVCIRLEDRENGVARFWLGIWEQPAVAGNEAGQDGFRQHLQDGLSAHDGEPRIAPWWHWYMRNPQLQDCNWEHSIGVLYNENQQDANGPGTLTDLFVETVSRFARAAIPCIDAWYEQNPPHE